MGRFKRRAKLSNAHNAFSWYVKRRVFRTAMLVTYRDGRFLDIVYDFPSVRKSAHKNIAPWIEPPRASVCFVKFNKAFVFNSEIIYNRAQIIFWYIVFIRFVLGLLWKPCRPKREFSRRASIRPLRRKSH